jgi:hypothetical protein
MWSKRPTAKLRCAEAGGVFLVIDDASAPGAGFTQTRTLRRGARETEKAETLKAGFVFDGESKVLNRPNDPRTTRSHEQGDQFIFQSRKPKEEGARRTAAQRQGENALPRVLGCRSTPRGVL